MIPKEINQFDIVRLRTTRNIKYMVAPPGTMPDPQGEWNVIGNIGKQLLISQGASTCLVPVRDVYINGKSIATQLMEKINGERKEEQGRKD